MTKSIIFLLLIIPAILFSQETKRVTRKHHDPNYKELFYVLTSNDTLKHGHYERRGYGGIYHEGYYKFGRMDSVWTYYRSKDKKEYEGKYRQDTITGVWVFYDNEGEVEQKFDFDANQVVYFKSHETDKKFKIIEGKDTLNVVLQRPPLYFGGMAALGRVIQSALNYPAEARINAISGKVLISFIIDKTGKTSKYKVIGSVGYGCDQEALRVLKLVSDNWIPAVYNGRAVTTEYTVPIYFRIL